MPASRVPALRGGICTLLLALISCGGDGPTGPTTPSTVAPTFSAQPSGRTVTMGEVASFSVTGTGTPAPTLEWRRNGIAIAGATGSTYTTSATVAADSGVVFTAVASNSAGSVTSAPAVLTVTRPVMSVTVAPATASIYIGQSTQLGAVTRDLAGAPLTDRGVTWTSSDVEVASVSGTGLVTGRKAGSTTITATSEGRTGMATITVAVVPVVSVTISPLDASVVEGQTTQLTATTRDSAGGVLIGRAITWTSSDAARATVSVTGLVTARAAGTVTITATTEGKVATASVTVTPAPVASVAIAPAGPFPVTVGATTQLTATTKDAAGNTLTGRAVTWASSDSTIASVSATGLVTARKIGSATITATSEGRSAMASFTVSAQPNSLTISVSGLPAGTSAKVVYWSDNGSRDSVTLSAANPTTTVGPLTPGNYFVQGDTVRSAALVYAPASSFGFSHAAGATESVTLTYQELAAVTFTVTSPSGTAGHLDINSSGRYVTSFFTPNGTPFQRLFPLGTYEIVANQVTYGLVGGGTITYIGSPERQTIVLARGGATAAPITYTVADTTPPTIVGVTFSPSAVDVSNASATLTAKVQVKDPGTGVRVVSLTLQGPNGTNPPTATCQAYAPSFNTRNDGTFDCVLTLPQSSPAGTWTIKQVTAIDQVDNIRTLAGAELGAAGVIATVSVTSTTADATPPTIVGVAFSPASVDVRTADAIVTAAVRVSDGGTGVRVVTLTLMALGSPDPVTVTCQSYDPAVGTRVDGTFNCLLTIPRGSPGGTWTIKQVTAIDQVENGRTLAGSELPAAGITATVAVTGT